MLMELSDCQLLEIIKALPSITLGKSFEIRSYSAPSYFLLLERQSENQAAVSGLRRPGPDSLCYGCVGCRLAAAWFSPQRIVQMALLCALRSLPPPTYLASNSSCRQQRGSSCRVVSLSEVKDGQTWWRTGAGPRVAFRGEVQ